MLLLITSVTRWFSYYLITLVTYIIPHHIEHYIFRNTFHTTYRWMRLWSITSLWAFGAKLYLVNNSEEDYESGKQYIWTGNHRSWIDHFCIFKYSLNPTHIFLNEKFAKVFLFGRTCLLSGSIPVDKGSLSLKSKKKLINNLKEKHSLCLFFEGTRGQGKELLPFRKGAFHFSMKNKVPLKPFFLFNTENIASKNRNFFDIRPCDIFLVLENSWQFTEENFDKEVEEFQKYYKTKYDELYLKYAKELPVCD